MNDLSCVRAVRCGTVTLFVSVLLWTSCSTPASSVKEDPPISIVEHKEKDGPERIRRHDFLMTQDPALRTVPTERLVLAEAELRRREEVLQSSRTMASNINWSERGPDNVAGRTRAILIDAADATGNTVWAGGAGGGLWKTTNFKASLPTWTFMAALSQNIAITTIAQHPTNPAIIYVGTGEGFGNSDAIRGLGIYQTSNGGASWAFIPSTTTGGASLNQFTFVNKLLVTPNGDLYAAARSRFCNAGGILRLPNASSVWQRVVGTSTGSCATSLDMVGMDIELSLSGDLYAATVDLSTGQGKGRIWKSPAGATAGQPGTWTSITPAGDFQRIEIACSPVNNGKLLITTQDEGLANGGTFLSTDGGGNWSPVPITNWCDNGNARTDFTRGQAWYDLALAFGKTNDNIVYAGGVDVHKSTNSGTAWAQLTQWGSNCSSLPYVHADIHAIQMFPGSNNEMVVGTDGGLYYSTDGGVTFSAKNKGFNVTQYYSLALHPASGSNFMLAGAQDNGSHRFVMSGINTVAEVSGGDGVHCFIDTDNPAMQITTSQGGILHYSNNTGSTFTYKGEWATDRFINPADYDDANNILYSGGEAANLRRSTNLLGTVSAQSIALASTTSHGVSAIKVDPNTPTTIWVAFSLGDGATAYVAPELYKVTNANGTPTSAPITLPAAINTGGTYISSIEIEQGNSNHLLLTLSNYGVNSVWESADGGVNWVSIEGDLPDMPVRCARFTPAGKSPNSRTTAVGGILLATELGVWSTQAANGGATNWVPNNAGMGNVRTDWMELRASDNVIGVATHGRGLFTGTFNSTLPARLESFTAQAIAGGNSVEWNVSSASDLRGFTLEKSADGQQFYVLTEIKPINGQQRYGFLDPMAGALNYYRLRMTEPSGGARFSSVVAVRRETAQKMWVAGNPFVQTLDIRFARNAGKVSLQLLSADGRVVAATERSEPGDRIRWDLPKALARGTYFLKVLADGQTFSQTVTTNH